MEGTPRHEKAPLEMEQDETGTYVMKAQELIQGISGYENMPANEQIGALTVLMEELAADNTNRFVVEELARQAKQIELYEEIEKKKHELSQLGGNVDVYV